MRKNNLLPSSIFRLCICMRPRLLLFPGKTRSPGSPQRREEQTFFELVKITRRSIRRAVTFRKSQKARFLQWAAVLRKIDNFPTGPSFKRSSRFWSDDFFSFFALVFPLFWAHESGREEQKEEPEFFRFRHYGFPKGLQWWSKKQARPGGWMDPQRVSRKKKCIFGYQPTESTAHPLKTLLLADLLIGPLSLGRGLRNFTRRTTLHFPPLNRKTIRPLT